MNCILCGREMPKSRQSDTCRYCQAKLNVKSDDRIECKTCHKMRLRRSIDDNGECQYCRGSRKARKTNLERHGGIGFGSKSIADKIKKTNLERYGAENVSENDDVRRRAEASLKDKHGGIGYSSKDIRDKIEKTNLERYGTETPFASRTVRETRRLNSESKHGVSYSFQRDDVKASIAKARRLKSCGEKASEILESKSSLKQFILSLGKPTYYELMQALGTWSQSVFKTVHEYGLQEMIDTHARHSHQELEVLEFIRLFGFDARSDTEILNGKELDVYVPSKKLAIEFDGAWWHSSAFKDKSYHIEKTDECRRHGIRLIHIFEWEWMLKQELCKSMLRSALGEDLKLGARKCSVREVPYDESKSFLNKNHIQGNCMSKFRIGLECNDELVAVMTFGKARFTDYDGVELLRYACKQGLEVQGGMSRLLKHAVSRWQFKKVLTYCNLSKFAGGSYARCGFKKIRRTEPSYWWVKTGSLELRSRYSTQMKNEDAVMTEAGYVKFWDCGTDVWEWTASCPE